MIKINKLKSGIKLVTEYIPYVQSVAMGVWVKAGAVDEVPEYAGISHFIEHMMFKGTSKRTPKQIAGDIDKIGGQINAFTGKEATCYYVKAINSNYHKAADVIIDMLTDSLFAQEEMDRERKVICEEIKMTNDTPDDLAHDTVTTMVFDGTSLGNSILGTPETLLNINHEEMADHVSRQYTRDSMVISVCGNFDEEELINYFDDKFMSLKESKAERVLVSTEYRPQFKCIKKEIEQTHICLATKAIALTDPDYYAFSILSNIMGGSMSSRFFQNVREEKGLAYSVYSMLGPFSEDGYFNIYAGVSHEKIEEAVKAIVEELNILNEKGVTEEELESSREQIKAAYVFGQENVTGRMFKNGKNLLLSNRVYEAEDVISEYNKVTAEDIDRVKAYICNIEKYSGVVVSGKETDIEKIVRG